MDFVQAVVGHPDGLLVLDFGVVECDFEIAGGGVGSVATSGNRHHLATLVMLWKVIVCHGGLAHGKHPVGLFAQKMLLDHLGSEAVVVVFEVNAAAVLHLLAAATRAGIVTAQLDGSP